MKGHFPLAVLSCLALSLLCQVDSARKQRSFNYIQSGRNENTNIQEIGDTRVVTNTITKFYTKAKTLCSKCSNKKHDHHHYNFYKVVHTIDGQPHLNLTFKEYRGDKLVNSGGQTFVVESTSPEKIQELYDRFKQKVRSGSKTMETPSSKTRPETGKDIKYEVQFFNTTSVHNGKPRLTVIYKVYKNAKLVKRKTQRFYLKADTQAEADQVFNEYKSKIRQLYKLGENEEKFSYIVGNGVITVFYKLYNKGNVIDSEAKTFSVEGNDLEGIQKIIEEFKEYIHEKAGNNTEAKERESNDGEDGLKIEGEETKEVVEEEVAEEEKEKNQEEDKDEVYEDKDIEFFNHVNRYENQDEFSFTTDQATYTGENILHTEVFSYTVDNGKLTATFKLYNQHGMLILTKTQNFPMESNTQGVIDRLMRQFTHTVHNSDIEDKEDEDQQINKDLEFQEQFSYDVPGTVIHIGYKLYNFGNLVHIDYNSRSLPIITDYNDVLASQVDIIHRGREIYNDWLEFDPPVEENKSERENKEKVEKSKETTNDLTTFQDISTFTRNQVEVTGRYIAYQEKFSYMVKDGEMKTKFKLYNSNGKLVLTDEKTFPIPDNNQAEIDKIMVSYMHLVGNGTGEKWVDPDDIEEEEVVRDSNLEWQEKFTYQPSPGSLSMNYELYYYGTFADSMFITLPVSQLSQASYDNVVNKHVEAVHLNREINVEGIIKQRQQQMIDEEEDVEDDKTIEFFKHVNRYEKQDEFSFTTDQATYTGDDILHTEVFSYTVDNGKLTATFKLYNQHGMLILTKTQNFPMESNTQGVIDRLMRQFTHTVHNSDIEDKEDEDQQINKDLEFQEQFSYDVPGTVIHIGYKLYNFGNLVHTDYKSRSLPIITDYDDVLASQVDIIHRGREIYNDWLEFDPPVEENKSEREKNKEQGEKSKETTNDLTTFQDISTFITNQVEVTGRYLAYQEKFSYMVKDGEMKTKFKLYNSNGKLVLTDEKTFPIPDNNQAEIDKIMVSYMHLVGNGTGEKWVDPDDIEDEEVVGDPNLEWQEKFTYQSSPGLLAISYELFNYGQFTDSMFKTLPVSQLSQASYDNIFNKHVEAMHLKRAGEDIIKQPAGELEEDDDEEVKGETGIGNNEDNEEKEAGQEAKAVRKEKEEKEEAEEKEDDDVDDNDDDEGEGDEKGQGQEESEEEEEESEEEVIEEVIEEEEEEESEEVIEEVIEEEEEEESEEEMIEEERVIEEEDSDESEENDKKPNVKKIKNKKKKAMKMKKISHKKKKEMKNLLEQLFLGIN